VLHGFTLLTWWWSTKTDFSILQCYEIGLLLSALLVAYYVFKGEPQRSLRLIFIAFGGLAIGFSLVGFLLSGAVSGEITVLGAGGIGSARLLGMAVIVSLLLFFRTSMVRYLVLTPVFLLGMMLSGSRAAILALVASVTVLWIFRKKLAGRGIAVGARPIWVFIAFNLAMAGAIFAIPSTREAVVAFALSNISGAAPGATGSGLYLADRDTIFLSAWNMFSDNAMTGSGLGTWVGPFGEVYPHNLALNFAVDSGVVSLVGFGLLVTLPMIRLLRTHDTFAIGALASAVFFLVASLFAGTYYDARFVWIFLMLGLLCMEKEVDISRSRSNSGLSASRAQ
jgi:O-antigen ligase